MGVKTILNLEDIKPFFNVSTLSPTKNGVRDTVYILDNRYILKLFEKSTKESLDEELKLLNLCKELPISKIEKEPFILKGKPALIYKKCEGSILEQSTISAIEQIGKFLKDFHTLTKDLKSSNEELFTKQRVQKLIDESGYDTFQKIFDSIKIELKDEGIIHGDLFIDNAMFKEGKLSCVFDFNEACTGDFIFDLAVTAISFCKDDKEYKILLKAYGSEINLEEFKEYIKYAMLYYAINRYQSNRDYQSLLQRIEEL